MQIFHTLADWRAVRKTIPVTASLGFVPTMGNLHVGHASLLTTSRQENDLTLASIFVNPTQFNKPDDFTHYPRTLEADLALLSDTGVDYCLLPQEKEIYATGYTYKIDETISHQLMEGKHRPGHFTGMLTIVMKLLQLVQPQRAYFGEKDYQQFQLIRDMVTSFFLDIEIKPCPTIRETSGLAYSSRNNRLTPEQRQLADQFARIFHQSSLSNEQLITALTACGVSVDYLEEHEGRRFTAVNIGDIRLIDNYKLNSSVSVTHTGA